MKFLAAELVPARDPVLLQLAPVVATRIPAKLAAEVIRALGAAVPLSSLKHLKRVRKAEGADNSNLDVILCTLDQLPADAAAVAIAAAAAAEAAQAPCEPADGLKGAPEPASQPAAAMQGLPQPLVQVIEQYNLVPFLTHVPQHAPHTREQWQEWCKVWPITWKVPDLAAQAAAPALAAADQTYFERHMAAALALASERGSENNAALIVDPATDAVVASAVGGAVHPLEHAAMMAIGMAAARDKETWPGPAVAAGPTVVQVVVPRGAPYEQHCTSSTVVQVVVPRGAPYERGVQAGSSCGAAEAVDAGVDVQGALKRPRLSTGTPTQGQQQQGEQQQGEQQQQQQQQQQQAGTSAGSGAGALPGARPYMCTGYDCFLVHEPCIMCAMALVHSRLQRVVYCRRDKRYGALGGSCKLHSRRSLNHHYLVYCLPLAGEGSSAEGS